ncbi:hypothetical protein G6L28_00450 [Agrobacterium larrymoorei]|nr:hypothetical protein [Agrobacterium larrymoorei]
MLGTISIREIVETVGNLKARDDEIVAAIDFLFQGF